MIGDFEAKSGPGPGRRARDKKSQRRSTRFDESRPRDRSRRFEAGGSDERQRAGKTKRMSRSGISKDRLIGQA
jgi:hypothetical protein